MPGNGKAIGIATCCNTSSIHPCQKLAKVESWSPKAGKHILALIDGDDRVVDQVSFSVRGGKDEGLQTSDLAQMDSAQ